MIKTFFRRLKEKRIEREQKCNALISRITFAVGEARGYTANKNEYADLSLADQWCAKYGAFLGFAGRPDFRALRKAKRFHELSSAVFLIQGLFSSLRPTIEAHNKEVAKVKESEARTLIGEVEGRVLDRQQMLAVIEEAHNHLIIAGAGTGKTTTVVAKIKYLIKSAKRAPEEILVLSFTNASASEMKERIFKETGYRIHASTFHKLGLDILTEADGIKPKITRIDLRVFLREKLKELMEDPDYLQLFSKYFFYNKVNARSEFEFESEREYRDYLQLNPPTTVRGEQVKSYGEMDIANFLFQNGVSYLYEEKYRTDTRTAEYGQYYPDFYLPDYDVYIEYFGVDRNGNVPAWFSGKDGLSAKETYRQSMEWKRKLHKEQRTVLIECYAYEKAEGTLLSVLEKRCAEHGVKLAPKSSQELWEFVSKGDPGVLDGVIELFETAINLLKSNNYTIDAFRAIAAKKASAVRYLDFIDLLEPLLSAYEDKLKAADEIDFNDMINVATAYVRTGRFVNPFTYVIVDEYQDISKARFSLLSALRESRDYDLFCVGDDWQSIYRFAGSDISYILKFEKFWGPTAVSKIETTYRFTRSLIEISGTFITQNPDQIEKNIHGKSSDPRFSLGEIKGYNEKYAVEFMAERIEDLPRDASVFFIGRYSFDALMLRDSGLFSCQFNNVTGSVDVVYPKRPDLKMCFMTAHRSKGLQADYVFILNNKSSRMGFPSRIQEDPILSLLLENSEKFPFAEERRLYYVALTRAKVKVYFLTVQNKESSFALEIRRRYGQQLRQEAFACPLCGGKLSRKTGPYGDFFGCENYKTTGCRYTRKIKAKNAEDSDPGARAEVFGIKRGMTVTHKTFGKGRIKGFAGGCVIVTFGGVDRQFLFPDAFEQGVFGEEAAKMVFRRRS